MANSDRVLIARHSNMYTYVAGEEMPIYEVLEVSDSISAAADRTNYLSGGEPIKNGFSLIIVEQLHVR